MAYYSRISLKREDMQVIEKLRKFYGFRSCAEVVRRLAEREINAIRNGLVFLPAAVKDDTVYVYPAFRLSTEAGRLETIKPGDPDLYQIVITADEIKYEDANTLDQLETTKDIYEMFKAFVEHVEPEEYTL